MTVSVGQYSLDIDVVSSDGLFEEARAFVVNYVQIRGVAVVFETDVSKFPCVSDGFGLSVLES